MKHIVKYTESERGYGGEVWYTPHTSEYDAIRVVEGCNKDNPKDHIPSYYVLAEYIGEWATVPVGYKF